VTGGTGLVGRALIPELLARQDEVLCVTRDPGRAREVLPGAIEWIGADPCLPGVWQDRLQSCDAVINLAGDPVATGRWSRQKKHRLRRSRLAVTEGVARAMADGGRPMTLISGSAVGYYGDRGAAALGEEQEPGQDFLARLALEWEHMATKACRDNTRVVLLRTGVVLTSAGGALPRLVQPFRLGAGGPLGSGRQYFPWIHRQELVRIILFALDQAAVAGPINAVVPNPPTQKQFAAALGRALGKPCWLPAPAAALRLLLGEKAAMLLASQRALPNVLKAHGYRFVWGDLDEALADLLPA
jgi:uncharacterized protein (TIGR01777 family)